jgi:hypothetical protein
VRISLLIISGFLFLLVTIGLHGEVQAGEPPAWANTSWNVSDNVWRIRIKFSADGRKFNAEVERDAVMNPESCSGTITPTGKIEPTLCDGAVYNWNPKLSGTVSNIRLDQYDDNNLLRRYANFKIDKFAPKSKKAAVQ